MRARSNASSSSPSASPLQRNLAPDVLGVYDSCVNVTGTIDAILSQKSGEVWSVAPDATVYDAVALMAEKNIGALVVMQDEKLVGIISERDYTRKVMLRGKRSRETQVSEIMSTQLTTVDPKESVDHCLQYMTDKRVRHLPVVENGKLLGVISIGDLVKHVISVQSATLQQLESYISGGYSG
jgi:signal-transduction protein with cAMP-binding, CBS, and nucleotidyltransferase domain